MKRALWIVVLAFCVMVTGCTCYRAPVMPPSGIFYSNVAAPLDVDANATPRATKTGEASSACVLGLFTFGDSSLDTAAREGGIQKMEYLDYKYTNVLFIYQSFTTRVHGE